MDARAFETGNSLAGFGTQRVGNSDKTMQSHFRAHQHHGFAFALQGLDARLRAVEVCPELGKQVGAANIKHFVANPALGTCTGEGGEIRGFLRLNAIIFRPLKHGPGQGMLRAPFQRCG